MSTEIRKTWQVTRDSGGTMHAIRIWETGATLVLNSDGYWADMSGAMCLERLDYNDAVLIELLLGRKITSGEKFVLEIKSI